MGHDRARAASSLRISFSRFNSNEEIDTAATALIAAVAKMRDLRPPDAGPVSFSD